MDLTPGAKAYGFTVETHENLPEIDGTATLMRHESGARLLYLANDDNDKAFSIGFKTPPVNDTASSTSWSIRCCAVRTSSR